jgi:hypothetical protein
MGNAGDRANTALFRTDHELGSALSIEMTIDALEEAYEIVRHEETGGLYN